jgi:hypothetical protein
MLKKLPIVLLSLLSIALLSVLLLAAPLAAQDYHRGWTAFQKGDYATALKERSRNGAPWPTPDTP